MQTTDGKELYRYRLLKHSYLWDDQAISGTSWEAVLERGKLDQPVFEELAALWGYDNYKGHKEGQMFVIKSDAGEWEAADPETEAADPYTEKREFYLELIGELALLGGKPEQILPIH